VKKVTKRVNMHLEHKPSDEMDLLIEAINEADLGWKADTCKYQKHHGEYQFFSASLYIIVRGMIQECCAVFPPNVAQSA
jgi:hypothetical protein